jgi:hypothetical protein
VLLYAQAPTVLTKRRAAADVGASQRVRDLASALPKSVWLAHLLPRLKLSEAAVLRATCRATLAIVADVPADLRLVPLQHLKGVLSCFPTQGLLFYSRLQFKAT